MSYNQPGRFSGSLGPVQEQPDEYFSANHVERHNGNGRPYQEMNRAPQQAPSIFHGEALARDLWAEQYGPWIILGFSAAFALFLVSMVLLGQVAGKSVSLKSISDVLQFVGEGAGFFFCIRIAMRLRRVALQLRQELMHREAGRSAPNASVASLRAETQAAQRAFLAWTFLAIAIALYASGQAVWTSYDIRMNSADVPFPGIYDIGFVMSYPFFLIGTVLLTRRNKASVGRARLIIDALAVIGAALALSWFFLLGPSIAGLAQAPSTGAAFLSIYFPTGDLFLVAIGAFLMFSPLSNREQQPVFLRLCLGLFFLAITDSLLAYYSLSFTFNTGTLQDVLWPLSMSLIGLAAIEYPRTIAHEQEQNARANNAGLTVAPLLTTNRYTQVTTTLQTITPFILAIATCAMLLTVVAPRGGAVLIQADVVALALILLAVARQALTLMENNRLTMQMRGELVISRRELQATRREADDATRTVQEKRVLEDGIATLREVHARVARGDLAARAPTVSGPLLPIAISLNLMLDRLSALSLRGAKYDRVVQESRTLQVAVERLGQGLPAWSPNQPAPQSQTELRPIFMGLVHVQRFQEGQWRRLNGTIEPMSSLIRRLREALAELRHSHLFAELGQANFERMILERSMREADLLEQQQKNLLAQAALVVHPGSPQNAITPAPEQRTPTDTARQGEESKERVARAPEKRAKTAMPSSRQLRREVVDASVQPMRTAYTYSDYLISPESLRTNDQGYHQYDKSTEDL